MYQSHIRFADQLGVGVLARADWIIDESEVGPETGDADPDPSRIVFAAGLERPPAGGLTVGGQRNPQRGVMLD